MKRILLLVLASALPLAAQTITPPSSEPPFSGALGAGDYYIVLHTDGKLYIASAAQMQAQVQTGMVASSAINASALTALGSAPNTSGGFLAYSAIGANVEAWSTKLDRLSALSDPGAIRVLQIDASGNLSWVAATTPTISIGSNGTGVLSYSSGVLNLINTPNAANALVQLDGSAGIPAGLLGNYIGTTVQAYNANLTTLGAGNPFTFADFTVTGTWPNITITPNFGTSGSTFAVGNDTRFPASVTGIRIGAGAGSADTAASTTGSGAVVLATSPTVTGASVNGVTLSTTGTALQYLNGLGNYAIPPYASNAGFATNAGAVAVTNVTGLGSGVLGPLTNAAVTTMGSATNASPGALVTFPGNPIIVCGIGDSIMAGTVPPLDSGGANSILTYLLSNPFFSGHTTVHNFGAGGTNSGSGVTSYNQTSGPHTIFTANPTAYKILMIDYGSNDASFSSPASTFLTNMQAIITAAQADNVNMILIATVMNRGDIALGAGNPAVLSPSLLAQYNTGIKAFQEANPGQVLVWDMANWFPDPSNGTLFLNSGSTTQANRYTHPTAAANWRAAQAIGGLLFLGSMPVGETNATMSGNNSFAGQQVVTSSAVRPFTVTESAVTNQSPITLNNTSDPNAPVDIFYQAQGVDYWSTGLNYGNHNLYEIRDRGSNVQSFSVNHADGTATFVNPNTFTNATVYVNNSGDPNAQSSVVFQALGANRFSVGQNSGLTSGTRDWFVKDFSTTTFPLRVLPTDAIAGLIGNASQTAATGTTTASVSNTTSETTLIPSVAGSMTIAANSLVVGAHYRLHASGVINNTGTPTLEIKAYLGTTAIADTTAITTVSLSGNNEWDFTDDFTCQTTGSSGTVYAQGRFHYFSAATTDNNAQAGNASATTINTTTSQLVKITAQWGAASSSNNIVTTNVTLERVY